MGRRRNFNPKFYLQYPKPRIPTGDIIGSLGNPRQRLPPQGRSLKSGGRWQLQAGEKGFRAPGRRLQEPGVASVGPGVAAVARAALQAVFCLAATSAAVCLSRGEAQAFDVHLCMGRGGERQSGGGGL